MTSFKEVIYKYPYIISYCRYIQGASSPKDMVILIDRSGSMLGTRMDIAKFSSHVLIETLTTNDFFHVITFNEESEFLCCDADPPRLLQATQTNKELTKEELKSIKAHGPADWSKSSIYVTVNVGNV